MKFILLIFLTQFKFACGGGNSGSTSDETISTQTETVITSSGDTEFRAALTSTWSAITHPDNFPSNPHFSSNGIEQMAEIGGTSNLTTLITNNITLGNTDIIITGTGISSSPGSTSITFKENS